MKKKYFSLTALVVIIIVSNIAPIRYLVSYAVDEKHYRYSNYSGSFTMMDRTDFRNGTPQQGLKTCLAANLDQKKPITDSRDTVLYRLFWRNPLCFWRWYDYFDNPAYKLPYVDWNTVIERRRTINKGHSSCQAF